MARKSRREIERDLEELDVDAVAQSGDGTSLRDQFDEAVVDVVHELMRDLLRVHRRAPDQEFLAAVRDEFGVGESADEEVRAALAAVAAEAGRYTRPGDVFTMAVAAVADRRDLSQAGEASLPELVATGKEDAARELLVERAYRLFADDVGDGVTVEVA